MDFSKNLIRFRCVSFLSLFLLGASPVSAEKIRVAVASNFAETLQSIAQRFETQTEHQVSLIVGSTGKHFAQIKNGAPFHAFFAADVKRPQLLEQEGLSIPQSRFTYAIGQLVLWSPQENYVDAHGTVLQNGDFRHLALANPKLAPYGKAAQAVLESQGSWKKLRPRIVRGENIAQAYQFVRSGNAKLGFVAYSQIHSSEGTAQGSFWKIPQSLYPPILQQAVLLKNNETARAFLKFVQSPEVLNIIEAYGYRK